MLLYTEKFISGAIDWNHLQHPQTGIARIAVSFPQINLYSYGVVEKSKRQNLIDHIITYKYKMSNILFNSLINAGTNKTFITRSKKKSN